MAQAAARVVRRIPASELFSKQEYKPQMVVAAYARVSTEKEEQEDSFERQVQHYTDLITKRPDWLFGGIYADPGITGTRADKRPDFMRLIEDCRAGKINKVLVKSISRFARNTVDALNYIRELKDLGVSVYFENENVDTLTPGGEVLLTILAAMAEQESRTMSTNIKWSYQKKFQNGEVILNTSILLGYGKNSKGEYVIIEEEAEIVRRIFREYVGGTSIPHIAKILEEAGAKTKLGNTKWKNNSIMGILRNEKYTGNAILGKTYKPDVLSKRRVKNTGQAPMYYAENSHPAIIEQELFDMAQSEMERRKNEKDGPVGTSRYTGKYPFSGILVCGNCGHRMRHHSLYQGKGKYIRAWGCTNKINNGVAACNASHVEEAVLERTFRAAFDMRAEDFDVVCQCCEEVMVKDSQKELENVQQEIVRIQEEVLALHKARAQYEISDLEYETQVDEYSQRMDQLREKQKELKLSIEKYHKARYWLETFKEHHISGEPMNTDDAAIIRSLTDRIVVYDDHLEISLRSGEVVEQRLM